MKNFTPCSAKHKSCSPAHAALVWGYRQERERQETELEMTLSNPAEKQLWKENGGKLITFKDWLIANKRTDKDSNEIEEEAPRSNCSVNRKKWGYCGCPDCYEKMAHADTVDPGDDWSRIRCDGIGRAAAS